jgi:hypothetical protein
MRRDLGSEEREEKGSGVRGERDEREVRKGEERSGL